MDLFRRPFAWLDWLHYVTSLHVDSAAMQKNGAGKLEELIVIKHKNCSLYS